MSSCAICLDTLNDPVALPCGTYIFTSQVFSGPIALTFPFQGMFIVMPAFQVLSRRPQPAHPLSPLAVRHVVNQFLQVRLLE
jgi:hypothetical protein